MSLVTSDWLENNLNDIKFLGFRGEALPSIASISELKIESCRKELNEGWCIKLKNNQVIMKLNKIILIKKI